MAGKPPHHALKGMAFLRNHFYNSPFIPVLRSRAFWCGGKVLSAALILLAVIAGGGFLPWNGVAGNLALAALITFAFFLNTWELAPPVLLGVFLLNWQPAMSSEIVLFTALPFATRAVRALVHWRAWVVHLLSILFGTIILAAAASPSFFFGAPGAFSSALLPFVFLNIVFGMLLFLLVRGVYPDTA